MVDRSGIRWRFGTSDFINGQIDEVRIWNVSRSAVDIQSDLHRPLAGSETGLVAYYRFNQGIPEGNNAGLTVLDDETLNNFDGSLSSFALSGTTSNWVSSASQAPFILPATSITNNSFRANWVPVTGAVGIKLQLDNDDDFSSPILSSDIPTGGTAFINQSLSAGTQYYYRLSADLGSVLTSYSSPESFFAPPGNALSLDGSDDFIDLNSIATAMAGMESNLTIEFWTNVNNIYTGGALGSLLSINQSDGSNTLLFYAGHSSGGVDNQIVINDYTVSSLDLIGPTIADNSWHHVAYSRDGTIGKLYVDGIEVGNHTADFILTSSDLWSIGQEYDLGPGTTDFIDAEFDEVRIWNVTRSQSQIQSQMLNRLNGDEANLVAYFDFDQTSGTVLPDLTGAMNDGVWNGTGGTFTSPNWIVSGAFDIIPQPASDLNDARSFPFSNHIELDR